MKEGSDVCCDEIKQYKEVIKSRTNKCCRDAVMVMQYILPRSTFCRMKEVIDIHTREVAGGNVNGDEGYKIGLKMIE